MGGSSVKSKGHVSKKGGFRRKSIQAEIRKIAPGRSGNENRTTGEERDGGDPYVGRVLYCQEIAAAIVLENGKYI